MRRGLLYSEFGQGAEEEEESISDLCEEKMCKVELLKK